MLIHAARQIFLTTARSLKRLIRRPHSFCVVYASRPSDTTGFTDYWSAFGTSREITVLASNKNSQLASNHAFPIQCYQQHNSLETSEPFSVWFQACSSYAVCVSHTLKHIMHIICKAVCLGTEKALLILRLLIKASQRTQVKYPLRNNGIRKATMVH